MEGEVIPGPPDPEPPSVHLSFIEATSKRCPCGTGPRQSLFHSHGCHAMKDNRGCNEELCVVCLKRQSDNERLRPGGSWTRCRCGHTGMHSFCSPLNSADDIAVRADDALSARHSMWLPDLPGLPPRRQLHLLQRLLRVPRHSSSRPDRAGCPPTGARRPKPIIPKQPSRATPQRSNLDVSTSMK
jgi:hypothetical protein